MLTLGIDIVSLPFFLVAILQALEFPLHLRPVVLTQYRMFPPVPLIHI